MGLKNYFTKEGSLLDNTKKAIGTKTIQENFKGIREDFEDLRNFNQEGKNMSFDQSVEHFDLSEEDLTKKYKTYAYLFYVMLFMFFLIFVVSIYYFAIGKILTGFVALIVSGIPVSKMFETSVNCYRLRRMEFVSVQEWSKSGEYAPTLEAPDFSKKAKKRNK